MYAPDFRKKEIKELKDTLAKLTTEIKENAEAVHKGKEKNLKKNYLLRKQIARIKTVMKEKEILEGKNE